MNSNTPPTHDGGDRTTRLLISVRDVAEALAAAGGGADFIDLKEPRDGALGGLAVADIAVIVGVLRRTGWPQAVSATIGDLPADALGRILRQVRAVAACGVDYVKVGIERTPHATATLHALAALAADGVAVIPVFIADHGIASTDLAAACALGFPGIMVDTADKRVGSLFDVLSQTDLSHFVDEVRSTGAMVGLAGALRLPQLPALVGLRPDFAGFRSAVCHGDRGGALDATLLRQLVDAMAAARRTSATGAAASGHHMRADLPFTALE